MSKIEEQIHHQLHIPGLDQHFSWLTGMVLTGFTLKRKGRDWLLVIRAVRPDGKGKVSFIQHGTPEECFEYMWRMLHTKQGMPWKEDLYQSTG